MTSLPSLPPEQPRQSFRCPRCANYLATAIDASGGTDGTYFCSVCSIWVLSTGQGSCEKAFYLPSLADSVLQRKVNNPPPPSSPPPAPGGPFFPAAKPGLPSPGSNPPPGSPDDPFMTQHASHSNNFPPARAAPDTHVPPHGQGPPPTFRLLTPKQIYQGLDEYVIGQAAVKIALAVGVHNHYKRLAVQCRAPPARQQEQEQSTQSSLSQELAGDIDPTLLATPGMHIPPPPPPAPSSVPPDPSHQSSSSNPSTSSSSPLREFHPSPFRRRGPRQSEGEGNVKEVDPVELDKTNILLIGPTGSGKTLLAKTLARLIDVPFIIADATCLTQAGYVGEDVESILYKLYLEAGQDLERAQRGIVYIDEIDKVGRGLVSLLCLC